MEIFDKDLLVAYRKAKVDMFYSGLPCRNKLVEFEERLEYEIPRIKKLLQTKDREGLKELCVGYLLIPKKVSFKDDKDGKDIYHDQGFDASVVFSNPGKEHSAERIDKCQFRLVSDLPVTFHVIMTWWILKIGERLEKWVSPQSYGNRIRRKADGEISELSMGTFTRYLHQYHAWRDNGLKVIRNAVEQEKKNVLAITADFTAFYHTIRPDFLTNPDFYALFESRVELDDDDREYTELIVWMINQWASTTPLERGLPVGCSVSAIIANLALLSFDKKIEQEVTPLYYGRYVDDIIIVLENTNHFTESVAIWEWLARRIDGIDASELNNQGNRNNKIYYTDSFVSQKGAGTLSFESEKTKAFVIDSDCGGLLINSLERQIKAQSSEWRALPDFPESENEMTAKILAACNASGEEVDNLRKVDALSLKRAVFAMVVRAFESYGRNLTPFGWRRMRTFFLRLIVNYFTDVKSFFDLHGYFPRIIATACNCVSDDEEEALGLIVSIVEKIFLVVGKLENADCQIGISGDGGLDKSTCIMKLKEYMGRLLAENICAVSDARGAGTNLWQKLSDVIDDGVRYFAMTDWENLYAHDLAFQPARTAYTKEKIGNFEYNDAMYEKRLVKPISLFPEEWLGATKCFRGYYHGKKNPIPNENSIRDDRVDISLIFPTRPINTFELTAMVWNPFERSDREMLSRFLRFERGFAGGESIFPVENTIGENKRVTDIAWSRQPPSVKVALVNWLTDKISYNASVCQVPDPCEIARYTRLMDLINEIIASKVDVQYVVFPELSLPRKWFDQIALKLKVSGISLIAGVEYIYDSVGKVRNQVWCSLLNDDCGFPLASVYKFEKSQAALHEANELLSLAKCSLTSNVIEKTEFDVKAIVRHGLVKKNRTFDFSVVICSDLTNIDYRSQLRGKIDALFVPSWNQDAEVFSSLVESAAYDIHAYIVQCNDRAYGDTRIRAPAKERYDRDVVKIKGGEKDYFVIGRLDIEKLRHFQSFAISPTEGKEATFKPVPCGFNVSDNRKVLPQ